MYPDGVESKSGEEKTVAKGPKAKLVKLAIIANATQNKVTGAKNWATVKEAATDVIVEATTTPNTVDAWKKIIWSGDSGMAVPNKPNQRILSRAVSKKLHVEAELGGVKDHVDLWVLWATVTILTTRITPDNAVQFGVRYDGTEKLGGQVFNGGSEGCGKIVPVATITPSGVHAVVKAGWGFEREKLRRDFKDGVKFPGRWDAGWQNDISLAQFQNLDPDNGDRIYDRDAPNVKDIGTDSLERYDNFRQWVEWNGTMCSKYTGWYLKARWKKDQTPQVTLLTVSSGEISPLPKDTDNHYQPPP